MTTDNTVMVTDTIERQQNYVNKQKQKGHGLGVVFADAFLRGMRDLGYKNPAWAFAEQIDNSFQSGADVVAIRFGYDDANKSKVKPNQIAVCDNGTGMIKEMISYAVRWGGTDREGDRKGFGRYGYGLPSSAVSLAKRYTVYSKTADAGWYSVTVDIDELAAVSGDIDKTEELLTARPTKLPAWLLGNFNDSLDLANMTSGTVLVFEDLDRLGRLGGWIKADSLRTKLLQHFGVIYRHWVPVQRIFIDGDQVQAVDPLFLMEHGRFWDETSVRAEQVETRSFEVQTSRGTKGMVSIRAALLPPNFQLQNPTDYGTKGAKLNNRFDIMKDFNGLQICREKRQIDCIPPRWTKFQNNDANVKIEIDFDPELDEFFGITTSKQQIVIEDEMWEQAQHSGKNGGSLKDLVEDMRSRFDTLGKELKAKYQNRSGQDGTGPRASVIAMEQTEKFKGTVSDPTPAQQQEAQKNLEELAEQQAEATGKPKEEVVEQLKEQTSKQKWEVIFTSNPEGPFYRPVRLGTQKRLVINTDHPFYTKVFDAAPEVAAALEVLLMVLADRELDVKNDTEQFYRSERQRWSERLRHALDTLVSDEAMVDKAATAAERLYAAE